MATNNLATLGMVQNIINCTTPIQIPNTEITVPIFPTNSAQLKGVALADVNGISGSVVNATITPTFCFYPQENNMVIENITNSSVPTAAQNAYFYFVCKFSFNSASGTFTGTISEFNLVITSSGINYINNSTINAADLYGKIEFVINNAAFRIDVNQETSNGDFYGSLRLENLTYNFGKIYDSFGSIKGTLPQASDFSVNFADIGVSSTARGNNNISMSATDTLNFSARVDFELTCNETNLGLLFAN